MRGFKEMTEGLLLLVVLLQLLILSVAVEEPKIAKLGCQSSCGNVSIPFPFGIGVDCYLDDYFEIYCYQNSTPLLYNASGLEVIEISVRNHTIRVNHPVLTNCQKNSSTWNETVNLLETPFFFSPEENMFTGLGCRNVVFMSYLDSFMEESYILGGCFSFCDERKVPVRKRDDRKSTCSGISCCQTGIPSAWQFFNITIRYSDDFYDGSSESSTEQSKCRYAFLVDQNWFQDHQGEVPHLSHVPVVLDWRVDSPASTVSNMSFGYYGNSSTAFCQKSSLYSNTSYCKCRGGYDGNPYLQGGCTDINECETNRDICPSPMKCENSIGTYSCHNLEKSKVKLTMILIGIGTIAGLLLFAVAWWLSVVIKRRKEMKRRKKFYERNGGLLLEQQLPSFNDRIDRCKVFGSKDLDKATDHFSISRVLGQGGQGTVYKGMLEDGQIIAVKKSKVVDGWKLEAFINEVIILSQINHRNVVKLLGCCLETEVPLLVYEFIPNGTLLHYLHNRNEELQFTWDMRLRIATEVAEALSYLHSAASVPIYHRDIKSENILLDEMLRAKVADFGISRSLAIDQTHVTTRVQGTFGYLDPEYYQSGQFTNKSDVYSFGVVLVELLTGDTPMKSKKAGNSSLSNFIVFMEENHLDDTLDAQVRSGKKEEIMAVAGLAQRCINLDGKKRPTMKEVAMALERIRASQKECKLEQNHAEIEYARTDTIESCDIIYPSKSSTFAIEGPSINDQPLMTS